MRNIRFLWPNANRFAFTSCWDDGTEHDRQLVSIFDRRGLKGTFNLCSGKLGLDAEQSGWKAFVRADEVPSLYARHEVACHTVDHPRPWSLPLEQLRWQMLEDRRRLESLVGYAVRGFVVPHGWRTGLGICRELARCGGFRYLRNTESIASFDHPGDFLDWHPTAHVLDDLFTVWDRCVSSGSHHAGQLFCLWGHSYELADSDCWQRFEDFCDVVSRTSSVWHATKGEIFDYVTAWRELDWSLDGSWVRNRSAQDVWFLDGGTPHRLAGGQYRRLDGLPATAVAAG